MVKLLQGKVVVFTGKLSMTRAEATQMAERSGAIVTSTVTAATNVIVVGADSGSKLAKAEQKGLEVWTEEEFIRRMTVEDHHERLGENKAQAFTATGSNFHFSLAWDALVDLDLHLETPKGEVFFGNRKVGVVELDVDRIPDWDWKSGKPTPWAVRPVENIICKQNAPPGNYRCFVNYFSCTGKAPQVPYTVHCVVAGEETIHRGVMKKEGENATVLAFRIGSAGALPTKEAATKPASKKPATKKAAAKKPAAVKAKKQVAKKPAAKKPATKKAAKKPAAKKPAAKKPVAKKAAKKAATKAVSKKRK